MSLARAGDRGVALAPYLEEGQIVVWWYQPSAGEPLDAVTAVLSPDERARGNRIQLAKRRREHALGKALVRRVLSRHADVPPEAWRFRTTAFGRPELADPAQGAVHGRPLRFNLSHTDDLIACAVCLDRAVGVDVERTTRPVDVETLAPECLLPQEAQEVLTLSEPERLRRFFALWTLKEATLKALGSGLSIPPRALAVSLPGPVDRAEVRWVGAPPGPALAGWTFVVVEPTAEHQLAVAAEAGGEKAQVLLVPFRWSASGGGGMADAGAPTE